MTVSRWTFAFLLLHNLCAAGSFAATVCARTLTEGWEEAADAHRMLDEVALFLIVLCVPASYLVGAVGQRCCGARSEAELEMEKMDKIYQEVRFSSPCICSFLVFYLLVFEGGVEIPEFGKLGHWQRTGTCRKTLERFEFSFIFLKIY